MRANSLILRALAFLALLNIGISDALARSPVPARPAAFKPGLRYLASVQVVERRLASLGDSITNGTGNTAYSDQYAAARPQVVYQKFAQGGRVVGAPGDAPGSNSLYGSLAAVSAYAPAAVTILIGANDLNGTSDAAEYLNRVRDFVIALKAATPSIRWVGIATMMPYSQTLSNNAALYGNIAAVRGAYNQGLRLAEGTWFNRVIDLGAHSINSTDEAPGTYSNFVATGQYSALYPDGLHPGLVVVNGMFRQFAAVMDGVFGITFGNTPTPFQLPDLTDTLRNTVLYSEVTIGGMGEGALIPVGHSGAGDYKVNLGVFGTGIVTGRRNGDVALARHTSSNLNATTTTTTLFAGGASDTFTDTTVATDPVSAATYNPADKNSLVVLSNSNRSMSGDSGTGANQIVRSTGGKSSGKYYIEMFMPAGGAGGRFVGFMGGATVISNQYPTPGAASVPGISWNGGQVYVNNTVQDFLVGGNYYTFGFVEGAWIAAAIDIPNSKVYFRRHTGAWGADNAPANPAAGTGGYTLSGPLATAYFFAAVTQDKTITVNAGQQAFQFSVPEGYSSSWPD